jgi:hypothetical protein
LYKTNKQVSNSKTSKEDGYNRDAEGKIINGIGSVEMGDQKMGNSQVGRGLLIEIAQKSVELCVLYTVGVVLSHRLRLVLALRRRGQYVG